jgi:chromosome partitioning protein
MTKVISIGIQKGGSAKTASTAAIAEALVEMGKRILVIDLDPQSSLTENYGIDAGGKSIAEVITNSNVSMKDIAVRINPNLVIIPSDIALASAEMQIPSMVASEQILKGLIKDIPLDYILIDCPPSLGQLALNALTASDYVLIPIRPNASDLRALRLYLQTIEVVRAKTNPHLKIAGIFATMADTRLIHHQEAIEQLKNANLGYLDIEIKNGIAVAESAAANMSIVSYRPDSSQAAAYRKIAEHLETL